MFVYVCVHLGEGGWLTGVCVCILYKLYSPATPKHVRRTEFLITILHVGTVIPPILSRYLCSYYYYYYRNPIKSYKRTYIL